MIFNEAPFVALVLLTVPAFFLVPVRWRQAVLILSGILFYGWAGGPFLPLVLGVILVTRLAPPRAAVWINAAVLVGLMSSFKMRGVFPLGLSFLSFEMIHFSIERRRGKIPEVSLAGLAAFALYFPCRIAGPIKRYQPFAESIRSSRASAENLYRGSVRILWGYLKKVVVADFFALFTPYLNYPDTTAPFLWVSLFALSLYIYVDFSAYSDMAIGISQLLGLSVPENFRLPYFSRNIRDFWARWHISLSTWLGDYLFLPIAKKLAVSSRILKPKTAVVVSYLVTFALCGLWHGPSMHFLLWGLYQGLLLSLYAIYAASGFSFGRFSLRGEWGRRLGAVVFPLMTFSAVTFGWLFFQLEPQRAFTVILKLLGVER